MFFHVFVCLICIFAVSLPQRIKCMMVRQEMITKMRQVADKILPAGGTVLLYGSRARGDARDTSDWDLLILLDKTTIEEKDYDEIAYPFTVLGWLTNEVISPIMFTRNEWKRESITPFYKNVERDKIVIV